MTLTAPVGAVFGLSEAVASVIGVVVAALAAFVLHALGHYYAGRRIVGVPADGIRIDPRQLPYGVALRDDDGWVTAGESARYRDAYEAFDPDLEQFERFVAGGDIVQTAVVVPVALVLATTSVPRAAGLLVVGSLLVTAILIVVDAVGTQLRGGAAGDYAILWGIDRRVPVLILLGVLLVHVGVFRFVAGG